MSRVTETFCDNCEGFIKKDRSGGPRPNFVNAMYWVPAEIYTVTNKNQEVFDFCSRECLGLGEF